MKTLRWYVVVAVACLAVVPTVQADRTLVLDDAPGDRQWSIDHLIPGPQFLRPVRDAAVDRNGTAADVDAIHVGETTTHLVIDLELLDLPPEPEACRVGGTGASADQCSYSYDVWWTLYHDAGPWGPDIHVTWNVACDPGCADSVSVRAGDEPRWSADDGLVAGERVGPDTLRWVIEKRVFQRLEDGGQASSPEALGEAVLCQGDVLSDFRFDARGSEEFGVNRYRDPPVLHPLWRGHYIIQADSAACPSTASPPENSPPDAVVVDPTGDVAWTISGGRRILNGPEAAQPLRDAAFQRNGTAADVEAVHVREDSVHLDVEVNLVEMPPEPTSCGTPPVSGQMICGYAYLVWWTYIRGVDFWSPTVTVMLLQDCRGGCKELPFVKVGDRGWHGPMSADIRHERVSPDRIRWIVDKALIVQDNERGDGLARLCRGDAFLNFRFRAHGNEEGLLNLYEDERNTNDTGLYFVQEDSEGCPTAGTQGGPSAGFAGSAQAEASLIALVIMAGAIATPVGLWSLKWRR